MASIIPGFEYDIFISYRQKDNKGDHWVSDFVKNLRDELEGTFKEDINIFFDENPHDGLHDYHDVDESLKDKLKCLVFIPILSRTYCDEKSFAFEHEFIPFLRLASEDPYGLKVKLPGGNVASRILPVRIHELDKEDIEAFEKASGTVLRPIDFVYASSGINRPLRSTEEHPDNNQYHLLYRDQINKVANAIHGIIQGMAHPEKLNPSTKPDILNASPATPAKKTAFRYYLIAAALLILSIIVAGFYLNGNPFNKLDPQEAGIAIIPFRNATGDASKDYFGIGIANEVNTKLALTKKFYFITSLQATLGYQNTNSTPIQIGDDLKVDYILTGFYQQQGEKVNVVAELSDAKTGKLIWSLPYEIEYKEIFELQNRIAQRIIDRFTLTQKIDDEIPTSSLEAYQHYIKGMKVFDENTFLKSIKAAPDFRKAVQTDSSFLDAWLHLLHCYGNYYLNNPYDTATVHRETLDTIIDYADKNFIDSWQKKWFIRIKYQLDKNMEKAYQIAKEINNENPEMDFATSDEWQTGETRKMFLRQLKGIRKNPKSVDGWLWIANYARLHGEYEVEELAAHKLYQLNESESGPLYRLKLGQNRLEELPDKIKIKSRKYYDIDLLSQKREFEGALKLINRTAVDSTFMLNNKNSYKTWLFYAVSMDDSARYYAARWPESWFYRYGFLCDEEEFDRRSDFSKSRIDLNHRIKFNMMIDKFVYHATCGEYQKADELLKQINRDFPHFGYYNWLNHPAYDRIKREYPKINETIKNLKIPPSAWDAKMIRELKSIL